MRGTALLLTMAIATELVAQTPQTGGTGQVRDLDKEDAARTAAYYLRYRDEIRAREAFVAAQKTLRTEAFRDALRDANSKVPRLAVTLDRFVTATGIMFDAVQLGLPRGIMRSGEKVTLFGEVADAAGKVVSSFEEPARIAESKGDLFVERVLFLPVTKAASAFGLAVGNEVIAIGRAPIDAEDVNATSSGVSRLIVSNNIYNMTKMQGPFEPFAFGGTKVVPKPDRAFRRGDEMWLFTEMRGPKLGADGMPRLSMNIAIETGGKTVAKSKIAADPSPLKGVAGHFAVGTTVDSSALGPGEYNVHFTVTDELAKKSYERAETVTIRD